MTQNALQLTLFETPDKGKMNIVALWDLAPRFVHRVDRKENSAHLSVIKRDFTFNGENYRVIVTPARLTDSQGERDVLPGEREQLVEDVIRKFAAGNATLANQEDVQAPFTVYAIYKELARHKHTYSRAEIKEALFVLNMSNIQIVKLTSEGKTKAIVSAPAFPALFFREENESAYVQLNPLIAQSIKTLAFEQVNYDWMMQIKSTLTRWIFKSVSLLTVEMDKLEKTLELRASEIIRGYGQTRSREREMLLEVEKAVMKLKDYDVAMDIMKKDIKEGRKKVDVAFFIRFTDTFLGDRMAARMKSEFKYREAFERTGKKTLTKWLPITHEEAREISFKQKQLFETVREKMALN